MNTPPLMPNSLRLTDCPNEISLSSLTAMAVDMLSLSRRYRLLSLLYANGLGRSGRYEEVSSVSMLYFSHLPSLNIAMCSSSIHLQRRSFGASSFERIVSSIVRIFPSEAFASLVPTIFVCACIVVAIDIAHIRIAAVFILV